MPFRITDIEGIGPAYGARLKAADILTTDDLLVRCATPAGRRVVAASTGLSEGLLLKWANMADLMRIHGVGPQLSELLEAAGVDTVKELRHRNADNLADAMAKVNENKNLANAAPAAKTVSDWIEWAKGMDPVIEY